MRYRFNCRRLVLFFKPSLPVLALPLVLVTGRIEAQTLQYQFNSGSSTSLTNTGAAGGTLVLSGGATGSLVTGPNGQQTRVLDNSSAALQANGTYTGGIGTISGAPATITAASFTVTLWYEATGALGLGGKERLLDASGGTLTYSFRGGQATGSQTNPGYADLTQGTTSIQNDSGQLYPTTGLTGTPSTHWVFLALTYNGANQQTNYYEGDSTGVALSSSTVTSTGFTSTFNLGTGSGLTVGNRTGLDRAFQGYISDLRIYSSGSDASGALSSTALNSVYLADIPEPSTWALALAGAGLLCWRGKGRGRVMAGGR